MGGEASGRQIEHLVAALILLSNIIAADPPRLPLPDHVHRLVSLNRPSGSLLRYSPSFQPTSHPRQRCNTSHPFAFSGEVLAGVRSIAVGEGEEAKQTMEIVDAQI